MNNVADEAHSLQIFDAAGRVIAKASNHPGSAGGFSGQLVLYDVMGRAIKQSNPTETSISISGAPIHPYNWQSTGDDASAGWLYTQQTYDWKGRPLVTTNTDLTTKDASYGGCGCAGGEVVTVTDEGTIEGGVPKRRQQKVYSDVLGRTVKAEVLNWQGGSVYSATVNTYNARDQLTKVRQYAGPEGTGTYQDTTMTYDGHGRMQSKHVPEQNAGTATTYAYNLDNTIYSVTDARGAIATHSYNNRRLVTSSTYSAPTGIPAAPNVTWAYDAAGNRTSMTERDSQNSVIGSTTYHFDDLSRMEWEERIFNGLSGSYRLTYGYNLAGQLTSLIEPSQFGKTVNYAHDAAGRLTDVTGSGFGAITQFATGIQYRAWAGAKHVSYGSGAQLNLTYNERLLPTRYELGNVIPSGTTPTIMGSENQFFADGRIKYAQDLQNGNFDRAYVYDHAARLKEAYSGREARGEPPLPEPDSPFRQTFSYDVWRNMGRPVNRHWSANVPTFPDTPTYTNNRRGDWVYNASGRVVSRDQEQKLHTYDATGQEIHFWEQMFYPEGPSAERNTLDQTYDGDGRRVKRIETREIEHIYENSTESVTVTTYYLSSSVLGGATVAEIEPYYGGLSKSSVYAGGQKLVEFTPHYGYVSWRHVNPVTGSWLSSGNTPEGALTSRNELDPFGVDVGTVNPYISVPSVTYSDIMGLVSLYEERGNPFDPGGGCPTLDGMPIGCSELRMRLDSNSVQVEYLDVPVDTRNGSRMPARETIRNDGLGLFGIWLHDGSRGNDKQWGQYLFAFDPQNPGYDFLRDYTSNRSFGPRDEQTIVNAMLALFTNECVDAFKAAGLKDPFTQIFSGGGGVVIGPASLSTSPNNRAYMGIPEQARKEILAEFSSTDTRGFTVPGKNTLDGRPRIFLNTSAFKDGLGGLVTVMAHEFIHGAGVRGVTPPWYKPWQDDLSFDSKYQNVIDTCRKAAQSFIDTRR